MKTLITTLALFVSTSVFAQSVYVHPVIFNMGNSAQVQIQNNTDSNIDCSGPVYLHTQKGGMEYNHYFEFIRKGSFSMRTYYLRNFQDRLSFTTHSIYCRKAL